ncbi:hypothetical protein SDC9_76749 [bioreactor metagenome]|uniref:Uncharacterized protein n=1 Tax=bioreactor metagenome TaxID=1076179 RepID=A0A644YQQ8_9ZZZZ
MPLLPVLVVDAADELPGVTVLVPVPRHHVGQGRAAAVALVDLVHRQPRLAVLDRLTVEDPLAGLGAEVVVLPLMVGVVLGHVGRVAVGVERHRHLADLAQLRQTGVGEPLAGLVEGPRLLPLVAVELVEGVRVGLREPVHVLLVGHRGGEVRGVAELVERVVQPVRQVLLLADRLVDVPRRADAVEGEVGEEAVHHLLLEVELERLLPAHHRARQHVVEHRGDQAGDPVAPPEPLVDPLLDDRHVGLVLLEDELDRLQTQGHVARLVGLRREAEGHRRQVAVEAGGRHERHKQQVGEQVLEREPDRDQELERAGAQRVVEVRLGHRQVPDPVVLLQEVVEAGVELVVVRQGVDLGLRVAHLVDRLAQRREARARAVELPGQVGEVAVGLVLQRGHAAEEDLHRVQVAGVGEGEVALALREAVQDGVEALVLLRLVAVVRVDGQPERVVPLGPVVDLDALVRGVRVHLVLGDVRRLPVEVAGQRAVARLHRELLGLGRGLVGLVRSSGGHGVSPRLLRLRPGDPTR